MKEKRSYWVKPIVFLIIFVLLFSVIQVPFTVTDGRIYQAVKGFYKEEPESLDMVYIGASNVYASWQGPAAWNEFGIAGYGFAIPSMPVTATKYLIEECRKTQPDALYIINLNNFKDNGVKITESDVHNVTNFMPMSRTKVALIDELAEKAGYTGLDKAEFYLPIIRFHSGWNEFTPELFDKELTGLKGASSFPTFLKSADSIEEEFCYTARRETATEEQELLLQELMAYIRAENVNALFVFSPQAISAEGTVARLNTLKDLLVEQGFPVLDLMEEIDSLELDLTSDFYNELHCNIHGALKFTHCLGEYLQAHYSFSDKRGDPAYADWDKAAADFMDIIAPHTTDFERSGALRSNDLAAPQYKCTSLGERVRIDWEETAGAEGYAIYRKYPESKNKEAVWEYIAQTDADTLTYIDTQVERNVTYTYTVVPLSYRDGETVYGNFDVFGISAQTTLSAVKLLTLTEAENEITVSWEALEDAEGYDVYRKLPEQEWVNLGTLGADVTEFTDSSYDPDLPYIYTVRAYETVRDKKQQSDYDGDGLLRYKELLPPEPSVQLAEGAAEISWNAVAGASSYSVYIQDADGTLTEIASHITDAVYRDEAYAERTDPAYQVFAEYLHAGNYYEFPAEHAVTVKGDK